jgi:hypothetical protein
LIFEFILEAHHRDEGCDEVVLHDGILGDKRFLQGQDLDVAKLSMGPFGRDPQLIGIVEVAVEILVFPIVVFKGRGKNRDEPGLIGLFPPLRFVFYMDALCAVNEKALNEPVFSTNEIEP